MQGLRKSMGRILGGRHCVRGALHNPKHHHSRLVSLTMACAFSATCFSMCVNAHTNRTRVLIAAREFVSCTWNTAGAPLGPNSSHFLPRDLTSFMSKRCTAAPSVFRLSVSEAACWKYSTNCCICGCELQKMSLNKFHLAGQWAHRNGLWS